MERLQSSQRIAGLDLLRALAIVLVLVAHYPKTGVGLVTRVLNFGWSGVDLFFVLSGYLIAGQLFAAQASGKPISLAGFYSRRWLRTLPNYYVVLAVYGVLAAFIGGATPAPVWKYVSFTQNVGIPSAFTPSWSLCVEEQFYLLLPIIAILLARTNKPALTLSVFGGVLLLEVALRAGIWLSTRPDRLPEPYALATYMGTLYYPTWCRLDGIALGVGLAAVKCFRPGIWQRLMAKGNLLLAASLLFLGASVLAFWTRYSFLGSTLGFTLLSFSFALLTCSVLSSRGLLAGRSIPGARPLALLSYAIYLTHSLAIEASASLAASFGVSLQSATGIGLAGIMMLLFAALLYYTVERPGLALRDRLLNTQKPHSSQSILKPALEAGN
jgi:peptidoglycan/LPS O-acetylase OafA/YrhL